MEPIFIIGFERFSTVEFISVLNKNAVSLLVDVRSKPHSDRFPAYNRNALKTTLAEHGIQYAKQLAPAKHLVPYAMPAYKAYLRNTASSTVTDISASKASLIELA